MRAGEFHGEDAGLIGQCCGATRDVDGRSAERLGHEYAEFVVGVRDAVEDAIEVPLVVVPMECGEIGGATGKVAAGAQ